MSGLIAENCLCDAKRYFLGDGFKIKAEPRGESRGEQNARFEAEFEGDDDELSKCMFNVFMLNITFAGLEDGLRSSPVFWE